MPETVPLASAPLLRLPLSEPPRIEWIIAARHGGFAREDYRLPELWCLHLYQWTGALGAGVLLPVRPGYLSIVAPGTLLSHYFRTGDPPAVHLTCGFRLATPRSLDPGVTTLPTMRDTGAQFGDWNARLERAIGAFATAPRRAEAILWDMLWHLAESPPDATGADSYPDPVARVREIIELRLGEPLRVSGLADAVSLSQSHLTRLFHAATGMTVVGYLRERRIERATQLLKYTTTPIKQIAAQVGLPDPHQFNKAVRAATGVSPRGVRFGGAGVTVGVSPAEDG